MQQAPEMRAAVARLCNEVWADGLDRVAGAEAERYDLPVPRLRRILRDQAKLGRWAPDRQGYRLVEFLARLGELAGRRRRGLVVVLDEVQQLLGPLDVSALARLREFVWGMRTERSPCALVLTLDAQLEARLGQWAADLLHRVREHGPALRMTEVFTREFPGWLWERLTSGREGFPALPPAALTADLLLALGQYVERPDLAGGPRAVTDVFCRALAHHNQTSQSYDLPHFVDDLQRGRLRFFGDGSPVQRLLTRLLADDGVRQQPERERLVRALAAFPAGCPADVLRRRLSRRALERARADLFGPLLAAARGDPPDGEKRV
jgi:hypothetical protein